MPHINSTAKIKHQKNASFFLLGLEKTSL